MDNLNKELAEEIIFKLNSVIDKNPNSGAYGFMIDNNRFDPVNIEPETVELVMNYYEPKGFEVRVYNDEISALQRIKLIRK